MNCLSKTEQGADLLTGYLAKTLEMEQRAELELHFAECADCRGLVVAWERLDEFSVPEVSPGFDARLYARIAAEESRSIWWRRWLWRPVAPLAFAAAAVAAVVLILHVPERPDPARQVTSAEMEQVAQALEDLDLLTPLDR